MAQAIPNSGKAERIDVLDPATRGAQVTTYYGDWGSGSGAPALADTGITAFGSPEARVACTITQQTTSTAGDTIRFVWTVTATATRAAQEAMVNTASSSGILVYRGTYPLLNIETGDQVIFTFNDRAADSNLDGV